MINLVGCSIMREPYPLFPSTRRLNRHLLPLVMWSMVGSLEDGAIWNKALKRSLGVQILYYTTSSDIHQDRFTFILDPLLYGTFQLYVNPRILAVKMARMKTLQ
jgi:hypothetical protein